MPDHYPAADVDPADKTVELSLGDLSDLRSALPARGADFRDQLPGLEPERRVTDWGRSERVEGIVDRTIYEFLYRYWFRVEVEGVENVPLDGPALLVANHSGALPSDGVMIAKAIREEHRRGRPVHLVSDRHLSRLPGLGMLFTKLGGVSAHPANIHRLLFDEEQLVLLFPEGPQAARKPLKERYRLRAFDHVAFVHSAQGAGAPIIPIAVIGAEEAAPVVARLGPRGPVGPEGPVGRRGPQGPRGPEGREGPLGREDPVGPEGPVGRRGPHGPRGPEGREGPLGPEDPAGSAAPRGPRGPRGPLGRLPRLPHLPLASAVPLPAKFKIRFLEPVETDRAGEAAAAAADPRAAEDLADDIRALIQENVFEMLTERRSVWLG